MKTKNNFIIIPAVALVLFQFACKKKEPPVVDFNFQSSGSNVPCDVSFENKTTGGETYYWDFGDGSNSSEQNPSAHTYLQADTFEVILTSTNQYGTDSKTQEIIVLPTQPEPADRFVGTYKGTEVDYSNANGNNTSQTHYNVSWDITKIDSINVSINSTTISASGAELYYDQSGQYNSVHITTLNDSLFIDVGNYSPGGSWGSHFRGKKQ